MYAIIHSNINVLLNGQQQEFFSAQNENYATSTANKSKFKYKLITFVF